jgi:hypothetical protein
MHHKTYTFLKKIKMLVMHIQPYIKLALKRFVSAVIRWYCNGSAGN